MDQPVKKRAATLLGNTKAALSALNAKFKALPIPPEANTRQTLGSLLALAANPAATSNTAQIILQVSQMRKSLMRSLKSSRTELQALKDDAGKWIDLANYVEGKSSSPPEGTPLHLEQAAIRVRSACEAGVLPTSTGVTLAGEIRRHGMAALSYLSETQKRIDRVISAGEVAVYGQSDAFFARIKTHQGFTPKDRMRLERHAIAVARVAANRRKRHASQYFAPRDLTKIYKHLELSASGVDV